ncbi:MAG: cytochrome P450 [Pseudomonadales bacterium]
MTMRVEEFDLRALPTAFFDNPYPIYRELQQQAPIHRLADGSYLLTRYSNLRDVYRDAKRFSSDKKQQFGPVFGAESALYEHHTTSLVFNDPPLHTQVRKAIGNALAEKTVFALGPGLKTLVARLLDAAEEQQSFDLIGDYAAAIPIEIIGNLLRVPATERGPLRDWSLAILGALEVGLDEQKLAAGNRAVTEFLAYLSHLIGKRAAGLKSSDNDIVARLLRYSDKNHTLTRTELYHQCIFLLNAGHETTTNLIGNGAYLLHQHPTAIAALRTGPERIDGAIEEVLRMESPNQLGNRTTTEEITLEGVKIPSNAILTLCIGAANRDPDVFKNPDSFEINRHPNPHLAFGAGIHTCAGLNVARLEARVALTELLLRFPQLRFTQPPNRAQRARFRGFDSAPASIN